MGTYLISNLVSIQTWINALLHVQAKLDNSNINAYHIEQEVSRKHKIGLA